jgi:hypothetical protein
MWTEAEIEHGALVSNPAPDMSFAFRPDSILVPTRLYAEGAASPGGHPTSSTCGRVKLLHPDAVNRRRSAPS